MKTLIISILIALSSLSSSVESSLNVSYEHGRGTFCMFRGLCKVYTSESQDKSSSTFFYDKDLGLPLRLEISKEYVYAENNQSEFENGSIDVYNEISVDIPKSTEPIIISPELYEVFQTEDKYIIFF